MTGNLVFYSCLTFFVAAFLWSSNEDRKEEQASTAHYIKMVCANAWPDFEKLEVECK